MKLIKAFNIEWETDGDSPELPTEAFFKVDDDVDISEVLADMLTDEYNYLVNAAEWDIVAETIEETKSFLVS